ncbi:MAG: hypothetical protein JWQ04_1118 [Pedosphaera sp.]|nr:hypothetical protein [Pedosphaera sp.]
MNFLNRLFSKRKDEVHEPPPEFLQSEPPDWLLDLKGQGLSQGNAFSIRVQLFEASRTGSVDVLVLPGQEGGQPQSGTAELIRTEFDRLMVILGFSFPDDIEDVPPGMKDGLPVTLSIHRREPHAFKSAGCNLAGWDETRKSRPPLVEIGSILLEMQKRILPVP